MRSRLIIDIKTLKYKSAQEGNIKVIMKVLTTGIESAKQESKNQIVFKNNQSQINQRFQITVPTDSSHQTKIAIIIMFSKLKQITLLGLVNLDISKVIQLPTNNLVLPLQKCNDPKAELHLTVGINQNQQSSATASIDNIEFERLVQALKEPSISINSYGSSVNVSTSSEVEKQKKIRISKENAIPNVNRQKITDISHKNYKNLEILRDQKKQSRDGSGSYKKRFQYQQKMPTPSTNQIFKKKPVEKSPVARQKTPQPIKFDSKPNRSVSKTPKQGSFSLSKKDARLKTEVTPKAGLREQNKYKSLTQKLQSIQLKIQEQKQKTEQVQQVQSTSLKESIKYNQTGYRTDSICTFGQNQQYLKSHKIKQFTNSIAKYTVEVVKSEQAENSSESFSNNQIGSKQNFFEEDKKIKELQEEKCFNEKLIDKLTKMYEETQEKYIRDVESINIEHAKQIEMLNIELERLRIQNQQLKNELKVNKPTELQTELNIQKRKVLNLTSDLRFKENQIKFVRFQTQSIIAEKKQLQMEIQMMSQERTLTRKTSSKIGLELMSGYGSGVRSENQLLREQIKILQSHNAELNKLLDKLQKYKIKPIQDCSEHVQLLNQKNSELKISKQYSKCLEQKNSQLIRDFQLLERDLVSTKMNLAEAMNAVFEKGGNQLVDLIQSKMTFKQSIN